MQEQKKKLLIDFDDTICESIFLKKINEFLKTNYSLNDFRGYFLDDVIPSDRREEFFKTFCDIDPYEGMPLVKGSKQALLKLNEKFDIYICSSCLFVKSPANSAKLFSSKFNYIIENLPFLDPSKFIFTASKDVIYGDILIDDYFENLKGNIETKLLFTRIHNKNISDEQLREKNVTRVNSWKEICDLLIK